jgi:hypothetical protein
LRRLADRDRRLSSRLAADGAQCRIGGVRAGTAAPAWSLPKGHGMGRRQMSAPAIARRGHRAPEIDINAGIAYIDADPSSPG